MANRLAAAVSPYLLSHADNPVDWFEWGEEAFAEAARRDVPVLVSIGYSTCHWCHVMARESFSDPAIAAYLNENAVAIKVDREEYPDVDASYLAAASAFTPNLGWPLNVFVTPAGQAFYAGTYWPPQPLGQHVSFRQILDSVFDAWSNRRPEVDSNAAHVTAALTAASVREPGILPREFDSMVSRLAALEDAEHGGFGEAPKFPVATVLGFLLDAPDDAARALAERTLDAMAGSALRDAVEGGFFRYSTRRDWTDPHYERMLYDNALLLDAYARVGRVDVASGIAGFLLDVLRRPAGGFASAQDSESIIDGARNEGGYYAATAEERVGMQPPAIDGKVLTGWNGLAIGALASAGSRLGEPPWIAAARDAAEFLLASHYRDGRLVRASIDGRLSPAPATLEDYGMLAGGLIELALATGEVRFAVAARELVDACLTDGAFAVPGGAEAVLAAQGLAVETDPSEGAYPSGASAMAAAAHGLFLLTADRRYLDAATHTMELVSPFAVQQPIAFGAALSVMVALAAPARQLVVVGDSPEIVDLARAADTSITAVVTPGQSLDWAGAGFELFEGRGTAEGSTTAYACTDFVCALPVASADALRELLG